MISMAEYYLVINEKEFGPATLEIINSLKSVGLVSRIGPDTYQITCSSAKHQAHLFEALENTLYKDEEEQEQTEDSEEDPKAEKAVIIRMCPYCKKFMEISIENAKNGAIKQCPNCAEHYSLGVQSQYFVAKLGAGISLFYEVPDCRPKASTHREIVSNYVSVEKPINDKAMVVCLDINKGKACNNLRKNREQNEFFCINQFWKRALKVKTFNGVVSSDCESCYYVNAQLEKERERWKNDAGFGETGLYE